jgi:hypothetical protein
MLVTPAGTVNEPLDVKVWEVWAVPFPQKKISRNASEINFRRKEK